MPRPRVKGNGAAVPEAITLDRSELELETGASAKLVAEVTPGDAEYELVWESSDESVAIVAGGTVAAIAPGSTIVTATIAGSELSASCSVTVYRSEGTILLDITKAELARGKSVTVHATASAGSGDITWSSSDDKIATVDDGVITAVSSGRATITARTESGAEATVRVRVTNPVTAIELTPESTEKLSVGDSLYIRAKVIPEDADHKELVWSSSDKDVAEVNDAGIVTALSEGRTQIEAASIYGKKCTDGIVLQVSYVEPEYIVITNSVQELYTGDQIAAAVSFYPANITDKSLEWSSSSPETVAVNGIGIITALSEGTATVTATAPNGVSDSIELTVKEADRSHSGYTVIDSPEDWLAIEKDLSGRYVLAADIDFEGNAVPAIGNPVGNTGDAKDFTGIIDGNGYAVTNAVFTGGNGNNCALVASLGAEGIIRNISIVNCSATGEAFNAMIAVRNSGLIENCYVQGTVANINTWWDGWTLGGVLVNINQDSGVIRNCVSWSQRDGVTYGLVGSDFSVRDDGSPSVYNCYVIRDDSISDWALSGNIDGAGAEVQPLFNCKYVEQTDARSADSYSSLNSYYWVIEDANFGRKGMERAGHVIRTINQKAPPRNMRGGAFCKNDSMARDMRAVLSSDHVRQFFGIEKIHYHFVELAPQRKRKAVCRVFARGVAVEAGHGGERALRRHYYLADDAILRAAGKPVTAAFAARA